MIDAIKRELEQCIAHEKAEFMPRFFQTGPGGYAEGDRFLGITVPPLRRAARKIYRQISLEELEALLQDEIHEFRFTALAMLVYKFEKA